MRRILLVAVAVLAPALAHADQCALNDSKVNANAEKLVKVGDRVLEFCEPCRERTPHAPYVVKSIEVKAREVFINGKGQDLAYFYVERGKDEFKNVGALAGCAPQGVSLTVSGGKPSGVAKAPPMPARPWVPGPSMPRATSADELAGTWTVKLVTSVTTCSSQPRTDETWDIALVGGKLSILTSDGLAFEGASSSFTHGAFNFALATKQNPSGTSVKLTYSIRDRFWATIVVGTPTGNPADPVCVTQLAASGMRK